ncbi:conserved hypothetical protein [Candida dubliniensis CD36]|uniref:Damage-regulated import facilitator 1 n=1 Tax=Candida dubliniensis (strain CD36 / ATCC MYA-646 / CBS 7987 / NCPF 3949 / NRRL Y-17841) TaxID=573826 RepID=B9WF92_CANDC|nr:conserved hypothetical protein [Candida dubliniensis CD36]CAX41911.1 conserved hypothetical protein [Candida dubliniensis CD36]
MMQPRVKRHMQNAIQPVENINEDAASLPSVAMRIRKAVSEGYKLPGDNTQQFGGSFQRVPLPSGLTAPPDLVNGESTRTVSNLEEWDSYYKIQNAPLQTLSEGNNYLKRKFEDDHDLDLSQYQAKYGDLKFNEEF